MLLKDFKSFAVATSDAVKQHVLEIADKAGRPYIYLNRTARKEEEVAAIIKRDNYWVIDQAEYSTDILFEDRAATKILTALPPECVAIPFGFAGGFVKLGT